MADAWEFNPGGCCCDEGSTVPLPHVNCPCPNIPGTLFLTFSRQIAGLYENATLTYQDAPSGWGEWVSVPPPPNPDGPGAFLPGSQKMWWGPSSTTTFNTSSIGFTYVTKTFRYCFACYTNGAQYVERVWRLCDDGTHFGYLEVLITKNTFPSGPVNFTPGTGACSPFSHTHTFTTSLFIQGDLDESLKMWNGSDPARTLTSSIAFSLVE